jgi:hypothetical protein
MYTGHQVVKDDSYQLIRVPATVEAVQRLSPVIAAHGYRSEQRTISLFGWSPEGRSFVSRSMGSESSKFVVRVSGASAYWSIQIDASCIK